jgi:hypothetical protein
MTLYQECTENMIKIILNDVAKYFQRVGIALSILLNVILGGASNQTFSARNYRWQQENKPNIVWLIDAIFFWDKYHCLHSWLYYKTTRNLRHVYKQNKVDTLSQMVYYDNEFME